MGLSKTQVHRKCHRVPEVHFDARCELTSFAGLTIVARLLRRLNIRGQLGASFEHLPRRGTYGPAVVMVLLVVHLMLGFRRLGELSLYEHDALFKRLLGLKQVPVVSTITRTLSATDKAAVEGVRDLSRRLVLDRLREEQLARLTLDFDGSVQSTKGHAEGTAVGFNKVKKGARSYYPLLCTVAQTGQFLDHLHRPGNVHDSRGAGEFMQKCIAHARTACPDAEIEVRMDGAFFSEALVDLLDTELVAFTCSVPFERLPALKQMIESCSAWKAVDNETSYFEARWKPKTWTDEYRFVFVRTRRRVQIKGPLQLDLFEPREYAYEYKVVATNIMDRPADRVVVMHNGRGSQEGLIGEAKQQVAFGHVATRRLVTNQLFTLAGFLAHNLTRELQMETYEPRGDTDAARRPALWSFHKTGTFSRRILHIPGVIVRPQGKLTVRVRTPPHIEREFRDYSQALSEAA